MKFLFTIFTTLFISTQISAQTLTKVAPERVGMDSKHMLYADSVILRAIENKEIPGAVLAVVRNGKMAHLEAYGDKSIYPRRSPMSINTIFDLASCSKAVSTAISMLILVERGELRLLDNVDIYIPEFKGWTGEEGETRNIRIIDLLKHTSGLPSYASTVELQEEYGSLNSEVLMKHISTCERYFEPTTDLRYSCLNYIALQNIIETVTKMTLRDFAKRNIFEPLEMVHTDYLPVIQRKNGRWINSTKHGWGNRIAPTEVQQGNSVLCGQVHDPLARIMNGGVSGNAGLFSDANDLAILSATLLNGGEYEGVRILSPLGVKTLLSLNEGYCSFEHSLGQNIPSPYSSSRGDLFGANTFGHAGYTGTSLFIDPDSNTAVILLTNSLHPKYEQSVVRLRSLVANCVAASIREPVHK